MMRVATIMALMLGGCAMTENSADRPCIADGAQGFVGRSYDASVETDLRKRTGAKTVRPVQPGQMVTMDFRPDRLTVQIDAVGKITGLSCG